MREKAATKERKGRDERGAQERREIRVARERASFGVCMCVYVECVYVCVCATESLEGSQGSGSRTQNPAKVGWGLGKPEPTT